MFFEEVVEVSCVRDA